MKVPFKKATLATLFTLISACNGSGFSSNEKSATNVESSDLNDGSFGGDEGTNRPNNPGSEGESTSEINRDLKATTSMLCMRLKAENVADPSTNQGANGVPGWGGGSTVDTKKMMVCNKENPDCMSCQAVDEVVAEQDPAILEGMNAQCKQTLSSLSKESPTTPPGDQFTPISTRVDQNVISSQSFLQICGCDSVKLMCASADALEAVTK